MTGSCKRISSLIVTFAMLLTVLAMPMTSSAATVSANENSLLGTQYEFCGRTWWVVHVYENGQMDLSKINEPYERVSNLCGRLFNPWILSPIRRYLNSEYYDILKEYPESNRIVPVTFTTYDDGYGFTTTTDMVWIPTASQLCWGEWEFSISNRHREPAWTQTEGGLGFILAMNGSGNIYNAESKYEQLYYYTTVRVNP